MARKHLNIDGTGYNCLMRVSGDINQVASIYKGRFRRNCIHWYRWSRQAIQSNMDSSPPELIFIDRDTNGNNNNGRIITVVGDDYAYLLLHNLLVRLYEA